MFSHFIQSKLRLASWLILLLIALPLAGLLWGQKVEAASNMWITTPTSLKVGDTVDVIVAVHTNGDSANTFSGTITYNTSYFAGLRSTYSGSICSLFISSPDPSNGTGTFSCGKPNGYNGSGKVTTMVLTVIAPGTTTIGLSDCMVLANDGMATQIQGTCQDSAPITITAPTPTPTPEGGISTPPLTPNTTPKGYTTPTPAIIKVTVTPTPKPPTPEGTPVPVEKVTTTPTPNISTPDVQTLAPTAEISANPTPDSTSTTQQRTIGQAVAEVFRSLSDIKSLAGSMTGLLAIMAGIVPILALVFGILILVYRLFLLDKRRRRTMDRLFELELAELSALEGKLDLLSEKGTKGKELYQAEFKKVKDEILRQIKPEFDKPIVPEESIIPPEANSNPPSS